MAWKLNATVGTALLIVAPLCLATATPQLGDDVTREPLWTVIHKVRPEDPLSSSLSVGLGDVIGLDGLVVYPTSVFLASRSFYRNVYSCRTGMLWDIGVGVRRSDGRLHWVPPLLARSWRKSGLNEIPPSLQTVLTQACEARASRSAKSSHWVAVAKEGLEEGRRYYIRLESIVRDGSRRRYESRSNVTSQTLNRVEQVDCTRRTMKLLSVTITSFDGLEVFETNPTQPTSDVLSGSKEERFFEFVCGL